WRGVPRHPISVPTRRSSDLSSVRSASRTTRTSANPSSARSSATRWAVSRSGKISRCSAPGRGGSAARSRWLGVSMRSLSHPRLAPRSRRWEHVPMTEKLPVDCWLTDMDGVLVHEERALPGAAEFVAELIETGTRFQLLTNNSIYTPRDLRARLAVGGIDVPEEAIWTSALATAQFLADQRSGGTAYVIGEAGLTNALHDVGYVM